MSTRPMLALLALGAMAAPAAATVPIVPEAPLIPRALLFGNPARNAPQLAPDGGRLAWLAPDARGVMQVWVEPLAGGTAKAVTRDPKRGIRRYQWAKDGRH